MSKLTAVMIISILVLLLLQLSVTNYLTTVGLTLSETEREKQNLIDENELLERKIATFSSLTNIVLRAAEQGYSTAQTYYLVSDLPVAAGNINVISR